MLACLVTAGARARAADVARCALVPGWQQQGAVRHYTTETLYEYMDGNSESYFAYGFVEMQGITCKSGENALVIDISEMADADAAYGIFSGNRDPAHPLAKIGMGGQILPRRGTFAKGNYYVEIAATPDVDHTPELTAFIRRFHPEANGHFYAAIACILGAMYAAVLVVVRFDYWEVRGNELLHHHGFLANLERLSAPNLRMEKEINDIFEYLLLRSGRLIIYTSNDRQPIVLDNVPFIDRKEQAVNRILGALQVQVRREDGK